MDDVGKAFASVLPGRIRLRHPLLRDSRRHAALAARLAPLAAIEGDAAVGSLLLRFDPVQRDMPARIRAELAAVWPKAAVAPTPALVPAPHRHKPRKNKAKWEVNRAAKIGAILSMAVSLAALGSSRKLHAQAGVVFLGMMLTHMAVHWRRTLK